MNGKVSVDRKSLRLFLKMVVFVLLLLVMSITSEIFKISSENKFWILTAFSFLGDIIVLSSVYNRRLKALVSFEGLFFVFHFFVQVSIGNLALAYKLDYYFPGWDYMNKAMFLVLLGLMGFAFGMLAKLPFQLGIDLHHMIFTRKPEHYCFNYKKAFVLLLFIIPVYVYGLRSGLIGFATDAKFYHFENTAPSNIAQLVMYFTKMLTMLLFFAYIDLIIGTKKKMPFYLLALVWLVCSAFSGVKSDILNPLVCMIIIHIFLKHKFPIRLFIYASVLMIISFIFVYSFRLQLGNASYGDVSRVEVFQNTIKSILSMKSYSSVTTTNEEGVVFQILHRLGITESMGAVVKYLDFNPGESTTPTFFKDFVMIPLSTFLPRAIFPWKSVLNYGRWVAKFVYHSTSRASFYLTIEAFFYSFSGYLGVFVGFFIIAWFLRLASGVINLESNNIILFSTFLIISTTTTIEAGDPVGLLSGLMRGLIIYPLLGKLTVSTISQNEDG